MPKVSVVLTSFNQAKFIREAIDSVLNQTFADFELIIWDDASTDDSWDIINNYSDRRIRAFRNEDNKRPIFGVIKAISEVAVGEYIAMHHADDVWTLDKLEKQVAFLGAHPEIGAVFSDALAISEGGSPLTDEQHFYFSVFNQPNKTRHEWLRFFFIHGNALCHPSVLIRKRCYEDCGLYRFGFAQVGDLDMWIRLCLKYEIHVLPDKLVRFRVREDEANTSGNRPEVRVRGYFEHYQLLFNYLEIERFDDLCQIFPESCKYYRENNSNIRFALAMVALEIRPFYFSILFALNVLFELVSNPLTRRLLFEVYGFDVKQLISLTGKHDAFQVLRFEQLTKAVAERDFEITGLNQALVERDGQIAGLNEELGECKIAIRAMQHSHSWRVTAPLRVLGGFIKGKTS